MNCGTLSTSAGELIRGEFMNYGMLPTGRYVVYHTRGGVKWTACSYFVHSEQNCSGWLAEWQDVSTSWRGSGGQQGSTASSFISLTILSVEK